MSTRHHEGLDCWEIIVLRGKSLYMLDEKGNANPFWFVLPATGRHGN